MRRNPRPFIALAVILAVCSLAGLAAQGRKVDACMDNPFPQASKGMERGLAVVGQKPPESVIVCATEAGETADDGSGRNGVFTAALLRNIKRSEEFTAILRDFNAEVRRDTNQRQKPAKYDDLTRAVYLAGAQGAVAAGPAPAVVAPAVAATMTVTRSYGSLVVSTFSAGTLFLDGKAMGELPAGAEARLGGRTTRSGIRLA